MKLARFTAAVLAFSVLSSAGQASSLTKPPGDTTAQDFALASGDVMLAATILTPATKSHTGVVMLPGSGPAVRATMMPAAQRFAAAGITVLIFDKRGSGESEGDWQKTSLDELAGDARAAMNALRARPGIRKIGLWAHSQGNWVATRAVELGAETDFLIAIAGGGASPRDVERYGYAHRVADVPPAEQDAAMRLVDSYFDYLSGGISRATLNDLIAVAEKTRWYDRLGLSRVLVSEALRDKWRWVADYEPAARATSRRVPTLVMLGGADPVIPLALTIEKWNQQLATHPADAGRIVVLPGRDHHLRQPGSGHGVTTEPEIWRAIEHWLDGLTGPSLDD